MNQIIIDGNNIAHMAFGQAPLSHDGKRTEIVKIGLAMVRSYLNEFTPDICRVVWDGGRDVHRVNLFPEYKWKKREITPYERSEREKFFEQLNQLRGALDLLGMTQYYCKHREADDVVFTLVKGMLIDGDINKVIVISSDQDMFQLFNVSKYVTIYSPIKKELIDKKKFEKMFDFSTDYFVMYRGIAGDVSDNLPGIKGIGPVGAKKIIRSFIEKKFDSRDRISKLFLENQDDYNKMIDLVSMIEIPYNEIAEGRLENNLAIEELFRNAIAVYKKYGFDMEGLGKFIMPFDRYIRFKTKNIYGVEV